MRTLTQWLAVAALVVSHTAMAAGGASEQDSRMQQIESLAWVHGPAKAIVGSQATLAIPEKAHVLPEKDGERFLRLTGNLPEPGNTILRGGNWWATFSFDPVGYVKDDEKLDPDALLKQLKESDGPANEVRRKQGMPQLWVEGWVVPPHYDTETKRLEWGIKLRSEGSSESGVNYTIRVLGRKGYENVILVTDPQSLDQDVKELKAMMKSFEFNSGERYSEFKAGDHAPSWVWAHWWSAGLPQRR